MRDVDETKTEEWWAVQFLRRTNLELVYWLGAENKWNVENDYQKRYKYDTKSYVEGACHFQSLKAAQAACRSAVVKKTANYGFVPQIVKITRTTQTIIKHQTEVVKRPTGVSPLLLLAKEAPG